LPFSLVEVVSSNQSKKLVSDRWLGAVLRRSEDIVIALDATGRRIFTSPAVETILGHHPDELSNFDAFELVHPEDLPAVERAFAESVGRPGTRVRIEFRSRRKDGSYAHLEAVGANWLADPEVNAVVVTTRDVTHRTLFDAQTGLPSRVPLLQQVKESCSLLRRGKSFALLAIGIDRLPEYASLGAEYSKRLVAVVGKRLQLAASADETVAHLGGGVFAFLARGIGNADGVLCVARRVQRALTEPVDFGGAVLSVTASIGVVLGVAGHDPEQVLHDSEVALAKALQRGPCATVVFDPEVRRNAQSRLATENDLRLALQHDELIAYYQPVVAGKSRRVCGFEALVRWKKPDGRLVPPGLFIPVAEQAGLIRDVDLAVMRKACLQIAEWRSRDPAAWVSVNLSGEHFRDQRIVSSVLSILRETEVPASALKLELTETALVENAETAAEVMRELQAQGVRFGLDDFGTGYSSLGYLQRFRFDTLKIDRSFIRCLDSGEGNPELVAAMLTLARALRMDVVAEGVETRDQLDRLEGLGCDYIQGFVYSPPISAACAAAMLGGLPLPLSVAA
jgi:PAS domain S-box-containing protein